MSQGQEEDPDRLWVGSTAEVGNLRDHEISIVVSHCKGDLSWMKGYVLIGQPTIADDVGHLARAPVSIQIKGIVARPMPCVWRKGSGSGLSALALAALRFAIRPHAEHYR